ncbi:hypothetical protein GCM10011316_10120 [Roseibium aquae]|uniref:VanZ like protein n=1 Tax=Roseibium aquae TaxID=1323746 RepID=A0A916WYT1_9HYPH|nr:antibiotic resistance protein VanZ [Roseibium aquae]GGB40042.1 hypothetical protein GCM10011316_10120 [Roseibium aquae]
MSPHRAKTIRLPLPTAVQRVLGPIEVNLSPSRLLPMAGLIGFGVLAGLLFNTGVGHPYDKIVHVVFFALLTLSIHTLFSCRLRVSAALSFTMGLAGEAVQGLLPHHESSFQDAFANAVGIALVVAAIALKRSEVKQALNSEPIKLDLERMGLQPVHSDPGSPGRDRSSDK